MNLPHNVEAEEAVVGAALVSPELLGEIDLEPAAFFIRRLGIIWVTMQALWRAGKPVDMVTVSDALGTDGDPAYLTGLVARAPSGIGAEAHAAIVRDLWRRREAYAAGAELARASHEGDYLAALQSANERLLHVGSDAGLTLLGDEELVPRSGLHTPFPDLNRLIEGFVPGELIVVGGRTGEGKSALLLQCALVAAELGASPGLFSLEMGRSQIARRRELQGGGVLWVDDTAGITISEIYDRAHRAMMMDKLNFILVDYVQLVRPASKGRSRVEEVGELSRGLKQLAQGLKVPVMAAAQLSRADDMGEPRRRPRLSDLRESGSLEQDADIVILIHRKNDNASDYSRELIVAKNRHGEVGDVGVIWRPSTVSFGSRVHSGDLSPIGGGRSENHVRSVEGEATGEQARQGSLDTVGLQNSGSLQ